MKKKEFSCEELSEIFDKVCSEDGVIKKLYPEMCESSYNDYVQLEKTVLILNSLKELKIQDQLFASRVLDCCYARRGRFLRAIQHYVLPSLAAASFLMVISFGVYNGNIRVGKKGPDLARQQVYEFSLDNALPLHEVKALVMDNNGLVVESEEGAIVVRSSMTDYLRIKRQLTLTEEEQAFADQSGNLLMTGTSARAITNSYIDDMVTFKILVK